MIALSLAAGTAYSAFVALLARRRLTFLGLLAAILLLQNPLTMLALRSGDATLRQGTLLLVVKEIVTVAALGALAIAVTVRIVQRRGFRSNWLTTLIYVFFAYLLLLFATGHAPLDVRAGGLRALALLPALFLLGRWLELPRRRLPQLLRMVAVIGVLLALFGLLEAYVLPADFWLRIGHEEYYLMKRGRPIQGTLYGNMRFWIDGEPIRRVASLTGDPLISSYPMALMLVLVAAPIALAGRFRTSRVLPALPVAVALALTLSRGALLTVVIAVGLIVVARARSALFAALTGAGFALALGLTLVFGSSLLQITYGEGHIRALREGLQNGVARPLGYGLGTASSVAAGLAGATGSEAVLVGGGDSYVGSTATQIGAAGLLLWAAVILGIATLVHLRGRRALHGDPLLGRSAIAVAALLAGLFATSTVNESGFGFVASGLTFVIAGILSGMAPAGGDAGG